jgi:hypothetical protein
MITGGWGRSTTKRFGKFGSWKIKRSMAEGYITSLTSLPEHDTHFPLERPLYDQFLRRLDGSDGVVVPRLDGKLPGAEFHCRTVLIDDL